QINEVLTIYYYVLNVLQYKSSDIIIAGDSAGGGLALLSIQKISNFNNFLILPQPKGIVLLSPWVDLSMSGSSWTFQQNNDILIKKHYFERCVKFITNNDTNNLKSPIYSPLYGTYNNFPTHIFISVSLNECLFSEIAN